MAKMTFKIPNGEYCTDKTMLDCLGHNRNNGFSMCAIHCEPLTKVTITTEDGKINTRRKCTGCLNSMQGDNPEYAHKKLAE